jgi:biofilm PGA synthesis N-glycosyltransferase PgaC
VTAKLIFWISAAVPLFAYLGYPAALLILRAFVNRPVRREPYEPSVTLLIPAYNEAAKIAAKIRNSLELDYPADKLKILVLCDGSRDGTAQIAASLADGARVRVVRFEHNRGKISCLNDGVGEAGGEIVVFSDATAMLRPDAIRRLMANFADATVGAASGRYVVTRAGEVGTGKSEDFYWRYETFLKQRESEIDSTVGAHGHLHAIRRELYPFPDGATINDDYVIPLSVLSQGYRAVYDASAVVCEEAREMAGFRRRVRVMAGNLQQLAESKRLCAPVRPWALFFFFSHKFVRLVVPFAMLGAVAANCALVSAPFYFAVACLQSLFYCAALVGALGRLPRALMLPFYFCMINAALFVAIYHALNKGRRMAWK